MPGRVHEELIAVGANDDEKSMRICLIINGTALTR